MRAYSRMSCNEGLAKSDWKEGGGELSTASIAKRMEGAVKEESVNEGRDYSALPKENKKEN